MGARSLQRVVNDVIKKPLLKKFYLQLVNGGSVILKIVGDEVTLEYS